MDQPSTCPQMDALLARHSHLRCAEDLGRRLAAETIDFASEQQARTRANLEACRQLAPKIVSAQPTRTLTEMFNDPLPRVRIKGADLG